jgi:hypothetical protein
MGPFSARSSALPVVLSFLVALAACGDLPSPAACSGESACPVGAWCRSGQCVANAAPVAVIEPPVTAGTSRPLLFRGAASYDADPGDAIKAWSWKVSPPAGTTGCEPLPGTGSSADLTVIFPCAGDHDVSLSVRDSMGLESAVRTVRVRVDLTLDPPQLTAGPDVSVGHRCSGIPLSCTPWDGVSPELALSAIGDAPAGVTLTYRWSVEPPPELAQQPAPRVTFTPGDTAAEPRVLVETAGTAISGRYTFVVVATDSRGMVAVGRQRVDVGNRPPVLSGGGRVLLPHGYDTGTRRFIATGETPVAAWSDPDGDPVTPLGFTSTRSGDGGTVLDVQGLGDRARITVVVPYAKPSDAGYLIGPGVSGRGRRERRARDGRLGRGGGEPGPAPGRRDPVGLGGSHLRGAFPALHGPGRPLVVGRRRWRPPSRLRAGGRGLLGRGGAAGHRLGHLQRAVRRPTRRGTAGGNARALGLGGRPVHGGTVPADAPGDPEPAAPPHRRAARRGHGLRP